MNTWVPIVCAVFWAGCSSGSGGGGGASGGLGLDGDSCLATADCAAPLSCRDKACRPAGWAPGDEGGGAGGEDGGAEGGGQGGEGDAGGYVTFQEVGEGAGVRRDPSHGSAGVLDWDGDGRPDLFVTAPEKAYSLFRNSGDGTFEDVASAAGLSALRTKGGFGTLVADYDNDGDSDVFVTRDGFQDPAANSLLRNDGGVFVDVAGQVGITGVERTIGALFLDYDNDGWLDLYVVNGVKDGAANTLYRNRGDGTFADVTAQAGVGDEGRGFQAVAGDYDGDLDADLYVVNRQGPNVLYRNEGDGTFEDVTEAMGVAEPFEAVGALFVDYDGDDDLDLFVAPENEWDAVNAWLNSGVRLQSAVVPALYRNEGNAGFVEVAEEAGVIGVYAGRSVLECDCDNDGRTDIIVGAGSPGPGAPGWNPVYRNLGGGRFVDEAAASRVGPTAMTHGMTITDFDGDGFEDIYLIPGHTLDQGAVHGNALYRNEGNGNGWLKVRLQGTVSNRDGIGARALLTVGDRVQVRELRGGQPFAGTRDPTLVFGLGEAAAADRLEIRWPSGEVTDRTQGLVAGAEITLVESR